MPSRTLASIASIASIAFSSGLLGLAALASTTAHANLLVNGGFEASSSTTTTPPGWFNIGHTDGVLSYGNIPSQPVYEGLRFYSIGGAGSNGFAAIGEGIGQSFASVVGATYHLSFGLSAENGFGWPTETLRASAGDTTQDYALVPTPSSFFTRPFSTEGFDFIATSALTTVSFIISASTGQIGNNDPLLDGISVELVSLPVPEPGTWALLLAGLGVVGTIARRRGAAGGA